VAGVARPLRRSFRRLPRRRRHCETPDGTTDNLDV